MALEDCGGLRRRVARRLERGSRTTRARALEVPVDDLRRCDRELVATLAREVERLACQALLLH